MSDDQTLDDCPPSQDAQGLQRCPRYACSPAPDVDRQIELLKGRGVVLETYDMPGERSACGAVTAGGAKAAWFKDSEGNILALIQTL